ncbi:MAG: TerB family tellurite resistance protein [Chromatiaceae bacterium]|nr:MAG: TerB family tellurite resistance protein [Chromatiaceae bacterium]
MLEQIRTFFRDRLLPSGPDPQTTEIALRQAAAALLLEMAHMDEQVSDAERASIERMVQDCFRLDAVAAAELLACAEAERQDSTDYFQFTRLINAHFDADRKGDLIAALWRVAFVDGVLDKHEEFLVRKIADLLYVPHGVFIGAKYQVMAELGLG